MPNLKISELGGVSSIQDDAKMIIVQDKANKVVTVSELSNKVNENTNKVIAALYNEFKKATDQETIKHMKSTLANHEYRLQQNERFDQNRSRQIAELTNSLNEVISKTNINTYDIKVNKKNIENNYSYISYLDSKVSELAYTSYNNTSCIDALTYNLNLLSEKLDLSYNDACSYASYLSYGVESRVVDMIGLINTFHESDIKKLQKQHDDEVEYNNTYVFSYIHYGRDQYWGVIDDNQELFGKDEDDLEGCDNPNC